MSNPQHTNTGASGIKTALKKGSGGDAIIPRGAKRGWAFSFRKNPIKLLRNRNSVKLTDLCIFTTHLATMTTAGLPVIRSIEIAGTKTGNRALSDAAQQICTDMKNGDSLSASIRKHPKIFNRLYCTLIAAGGKNGELKDSFYNLAQLLEKIEVQSRKIKNVLLFSSCSIVFSLCISFILLLTIPKSFALFNTISGKLPAPAITVRVLSGFLANNSLLVITLCGFMASLFYLSLKTKKGSYLWDAIQLKIPVIGEIKRKSSAYIFLKTFALLTNSGINNKNACALSAECSGNRVFQKVINKCIKQKSNTNSFRQLIKRTGMFPPIVITMISLAEIKGTIITVLNKISLFYEEEANAALDAFTSIIEPFIVLLLGIVIGCLLLAIYLPHYL